MPLTQVPLSMTDSTTQQSFVPVGTVLPFTGATAPAGYLICDGSSLTASAYPALAAVMWNASGSNYSHGGSGTFPAGSFNIPDHRGRFLRGVDGAATRDPDSGSRTAMNTGGNATNNVGSVQGHQFATHAHGQNVYNGNDNSGQVPRGSQSAVFQGNAFNTTSVGGNETRPLNAYVNYIIKF